MDTGASCSDCGAPLGDKTASKRCPTCAQADDLLSGPRPAAATRQQPTRPFDDGRILRTGALSQTTTNPVSTMPRLMTADVEAAVSATSAAPGDDDGFTLAETSEAGAAREAWSIGVEATADDRTEPPIASTRSALPPALLVTAGLVALIAVGALLSVTAKPGLPDGAEGSGPAAAQAASDRDASGSGLQPTANPAPEKRSPRPKPEPANAPTPAPTGDAGAAALLPSKDANAAAAAPGATAQPPDFDANMRAGRAALDRGNLSDALTSFKAAAALRPRSAEAVTGIARSQAGSEQNAEAIRSFEAAVVLNPNYAPAWSGLAHLRETSGNRDGAIDAYRRLLAISPDSRDAEIAREALEDLGVTEP